MLVNKLRLFMFSIILFIIVIIFLLISILPNTADSINKSNYFRVNNISKSSNNLSINNLRSNNNINSLKSMKMTIPSLIYGTAWKKERTKDLVELAVKTGFRGIDTACQPKHYNEPGIGLALQQLYQDNIITRSDIFLQTKFTPIRGQDPNNIPYDTSLSLDKQVAMSFEVSLKNLKTDYIDSILLHSPLSNLSDTLIAWRVFEQLVDNKKVYHIGLSNTYDLSLLQQIFNEARIKPSFIQNRFYRDSNYDKGIRKFCESNGIVYQSFWTLTANPHILSNSIIKSLANKYNKTNEQIFFNYVNSLGIVILTGTTSSQHMIQDLQSTKDFFTLTTDEIESINQLL